MPTPTLTIDIIEGAQMFTNISGGKHVRVGHIKDLNVSATNDPMVFHKALAVSGMPQRGERHPSGDGTVVISHRFYGKANDQARVEIVYETPGGFEIPDTIFVLEDDTILTSRTTLKIPGIDQYVRVEANALAQPKYNYNGTITPPTYVGDSPPLHYLAPMRTLSYRQLVLTEPSPFLPTMVGVVNDRQWYGLPAGYWLCAHIGKIIRTFEKDDKPGSWMTSGAFITKQREDWSDWLGLRGPDGKMYYVSQRNLQLLGGVGYATIRSNGGIALTNNASRVAPYDMADFHSIFGL